MFSLNTQSSIWSEKEYRIYCFPNRIQYEIVLEGAGYLTDVNYFGGYSSSQLRWGSGFFWSGQNFDKGFNPEPNMQEKIYFSADGTSQIDLMGVPLPARGDWFFTPPPFCFVMEHEGSWLSFGIESERGENSYTQFVYHGTSGGFYLTLHFEGETSVKGRKVLPRIGIDFAIDPYEGLNAHVQSLYKQNIIPENTTSKQHTWWKQPIFCGWGEQCYLASQEDGHAPDYARQENYDKFLSILEENSIEPGIIVIDDKWQKTYGDNKVDCEKWPNIRAFIDRQHAKNRKVLLWLKAWESEGLPSEECITNASGKVVALDPTHPQCETRIRRAVQRMLSPDGYDADGFKIDFTARIPSGPNMHLYQDVWGLELMKLYLGIIYSESKNAKQDALIISHTPHPYLADVTDMIRLNDINTGQPVNPAMEHRAKVARIACPNLLIDTDNWPMPDKATWRKYIYIQPKLGVPSLYYASHIDASGEVFTNADYALIREVWKQWKAQQEVDIL
jgi:hypothetical protein